MLRLVPLTAVVKKDFHLVEGFLGESRGPSTTEQAWQRGAFHASPVRHRSLRAQMLMGWLNEPPWAPWGDDTEDDAEAVAIKVRADAAAGRVAVRRSRR